VKCYIDRLRELPQTHLNGMIAKQKRDIALLEKDLDRMLIVLGEKVAESND